MKVLRIFWLILVTNLLPNPLGASVTVNEVVDQWGRLYFCEHHIFSIETLERRRQIYQSDYQELNEALAFVESYSLSKYGADQTKKMLTQANIQGYFSNWGNKKVTELDDDETIEALNWCRDLIQTVIAP